MRPFLSVLLVVFSQAPALAQEAKPPAAPLAALEFRRFLGQWSGAGTLARTGRPIASTLRVETAADGEAILLTEKDAAPNRFAYSAVLSRDAKAGQTILILAGNLGAGARLFRCAEWRDARLVCSVDPGLRAAFALERFTFTWRGPDAFDLGYEFSRDGSQWLLGEVQTYRRIAT